MTFLWTEQLAASSPPFRGEGVPIKAKKIDALKLLAPIETSLAPHRAPEYRPRESLVALARTGKGSYADEADALVILGSTGQKGNFRGEITVVPEADVRKVVEPGVDRWVQQYGMAGALEILGLLGAWKPYDLMTPGLTIWLARVRMRQHLAHAPDYDAALARANELAGGGLPACKGKSYDATYEVLSYLFPDHRPFFAEASAAIARRDWVSSCLLGSVTSEAEYRSIASIGHVDVSNNALVIPRSLREAGLPILVELAAKLDTNEGVAHALTAYVSPEAAAALAAFIAAKPCVKIVTAYFTAHPELAKAALGPLTSSKKKAVRDGAAKILAAVG
jgi:hypothetical protein